MFSGWKKAFIFFWYFNNIFSVYIKEFHNFYFLTFHKISTFFLAHHHKKFPLFAQKFFSKQFSHSTKTDIFHFSLFSTRDLKNSSESLISSYLLNAKNKHSIAFESWKKIHNFHKVFHNFYFTAVSNFFASGSFESQNITLSANFPQIFRVSVPNMFKLLSWWVKLDSKVSFARFIQHWNLFSPLYSRVLVWRRKKNFHFAATQTTF